MNEKKERKRRKNQKKKEEREVPRRIHLQGDQEKEGGRIDEKKTNEKCVTFPFQLFVFQLFLQLFFVKNQTEKKFFHILLSLSTHRGSIRRNSKEVTYYSFSSQANKD